MKFNLNLDNINYIKIVYKDRNDSACCTKAAIKHIGEREIFACAKFEDGINIKTPQEVSLSFICDNGLYRTTTTLKYTEYRDPYVFFTLHTPIGLEYQQNREYFRVRMDEDALLSFKSGIKSYILPCKVHDISANGVRLELKEPISEPDEIVIDLLFKPRSIKTEAKFIRFDEEDGILKASFQFVNMPESDMDIISQKCIQKQLEYKRNTNLM